MKHEKWEDYSHHEIYKTIQKKCRYCKHAYTGSGDRGNANGLFCCYIVDTGHRRPCRPEDCPGYPRLKKKVKRLYIERGNHEINTAYLRNGR